MKQTAYPRACLRCWLSPRLRPIRSRSWSWTTAAPTGRSSWQAGDWPQFLGPNRNGTAADGKLARTWPTEGPKKVWEFKVSQGFGGAAIAGGKVYFMDRAGQDQDVLHCLDLATGQEDWSYAYDAPGKVEHPGSRATPAVDDKYVFTVGCFGQVTCVDKATHKPVWTHHLIDDFAGKPGYWGIAQSALVYKDWVILAPQTPQAGVVAYEKATGKLVWKSDPIGSLNTAYASPMLAEVAGQEQIVMLSQQAGGARINVVGLNPADGKILWTYNRWNCNIVIPQPVACGEGRFFVTGGYEAGSAMFKVEKQDDKFVVTQLFNGNKAPKPKPASGSAPAAAPAAEAVQPGTECSSHLHTPIFYKDCLFANGNSVQNNKLGIVCLGLDGLAKWKTGNKPPVDIGDLILVDDLLLSLDGGSGTLRLLEASPAGYKQLAEAKVLNQRQEVWAPMSLADGKLIVRDHTVMKCLDLRGQP
jgi:hypothetical protein